MEKETFDSKGTCENDIELDRYFVNSVIKFTNIISPKARNKVLWRFDSDTYTASITAILPGIWSGVDLVPHVEISRLLPSFASSPYRKYLNPISLDFMGSLKPLGVLLIFSNCVAYRFNGEQLKISNYLPEDDISDCDVKKYIHHGILRVGIPEQYWPYRSAILHRMLIETRRSSMLEEKPVRPSKVEEKGIGKEIETVQKDKSGSKPTKPSPVPSSKLEEKGEKEKKPSTKSPPPPFAQNTENSGNDEQDDTPFEEDDVNGDYIPYEFNSDNTEISETETPAEDGESDTGVSQELPEQNTPSIEISDSAPELETKNTKENTENSDSDSEKTQAGKSETQNERKLTTSTRGKRKKRTREEIKSDTMAEVESWGYKVIPNYDPENFSEAIGILAKLTEHMTSVLDKAKYLETEYEITTENTKEEVLSKIEQMLPEDPAEKMTYISDLLKGTNA